MIVGKLQVAGEEDEGEEARRDYVIRVGGDDEAFASQADGVQDKGCFGRTRTL